MGNGELPVERDEPVLVGTDPGVLVAAVTCDVVVVVVVVVAPTTGTDGLVEGTEVTVARTGQRSVESGLIRGGGSAGVPVPEASNRSPMATAVSAR